MGAMTSVMVGLGAVSAVQQVMGGFAAGEEADYNAAQTLSESRYNASILEQQAGMIEDQKNLKLAQDKRVIRFTMGKTVSMTAGKGIELSGSPMAIMIDTQTQMEMDMAIGQYNLEVQKYGVLSQREATLRRGETIASQYRRAGDTARTAGVVGGLTTLFKTAAYASESSFDVGSMAKRGGGA